MALRFGAAYVRPSQNQGDISMRAASFGTSVALVAALSILPAHADKPSTPVTVVNPEVPVTVTNPATSPVPTTVLNPATMPALTSSIDDPGRNP